MLSKICYHHSCSRTTASGFVCGRYNISNTTNLIVWPNDDNRLPWHLSLPAMIEGECVW